MDSETLQTVVFVLVAIGALAAGVYGYAAGEKGLRTPSA